MARPFLDPKTSRKLIFPETPSSALSRKSDRLPGVRHEVVMLALALIQMISQALQPADEKIQAGAVGMQVNDADRVAREVQDMIEMGHMF